MAAPSAEVMISPEVDRSALNRMNKQFSQNFKKVAKDAERQIEKGVSDGIKDGGKKGRGALARLFRGGGGAVRGGYNKLGGARGIATGIGGLALAGLIDSIDKASQGRDLIAGLLGESTAAGQLSGAKAAGFSTKQFGQFSAQLQNIGGLQDQTAIADLLQDINVKVQEAKAEGGGLLNQFTGYTGQERVNRVLASVSQQSPAQQQQTLDAMGISGEDSRALLAVIQEAGRGRNADEALEFLNTSNAAEGADIGQNLETEATLAKEYRSQQIEFNNEMRSKLLANIDGGKITNLFESRNVEVEKQVKLLENFEANQKLATQANKDLKLAMDALNATTRQMFEGFGLIKDEIIKLTAAVSEFDLTEKLKSLNPFSRGGD